MRTRELALGALLGGLAAVIPIAFGFLQVRIPPFTATLTSHVPVMLGMFVSPLAALAAGVGSTLGFLTTLGATVGARASIHILWGVLGAWVYRRRWKPWVVLLAMLPVHALGEALVVLPFGYDLQKAGVVVGVGTALHHLVDAGITLLVLGALGLVKTPAKTRA